MYYVRTIEEAWLETSKEFPVLLLTGPRQIGKTTTLKHLIDDGCVICMVDKNLPIDSNNSAISVNYLG